MTKQVRQILMAHKEDALLRAFQFGKTSIADELAFLSEAGTPICPDNIGSRHMEQLRLSASVTELTWPALLYARLT